MILSCERLPGQPVGPPKHANENGAYTLQAMSLTYLRNSAKLEATVDWKGVSFGIFAPGFRPGGLSRGMIV